MPVCATHHLEHSPDHLKREVCVEDVGHAVHEDASWRSQSEWAFEPFLPESRCKWIARQRRIRTNRCLFEVNVARPPVGDRVSVAMVATGRNPGAAGHWIPNL